MKTYKVWLLSLRNDVIASLIPVYSQLTERGHLPSIPLEQVCTYVNDADTVGNIFGTPVVEQLSVRRHIFWMSSVC